MVNASICKVDMIYIDDNLCTGCGTCLDVCDRSAITLDGCTASITQESCTSCGQCVDVCPVGAIIQVEPIEAMSSALVRERAASVPRDTLTAPSAPLSALPVASTSGASRFASIEHLLSGVFGLVGSALELKRATSNSSRLIASGGRRSGGGCSAVGPGRGPRAEAGRGRRHERRRGGRAHGCM